MATWIKYSMSGGKDPFVLNLDEVQVFSTSYSGVVVVLHMNMGRFEVNRGSNPTVHQQILDYVKQKTGHDLV